MNVILMIIDQRSFSVFLCDHTQMDDLILSFDVSVFSVRLLLSGTDLCSCRIKVGSDHVAASQSV